MIKFTIPVPSQAFVMKLCRYRTNHGDAKQNSSKHFAIWKISKSIRLKYVWDKVMNHQRIDKSNMVRCLKYTTLLMLNTMIIVIASLVQYKMQIDSFVTIVRLIFWLVFESGIVSFGWYGFLELYSFETIIVRCLSHGIDFDIQIQRLHQT